MHRPVIYFLRISGDFLENLIETLTWESWDRFTNCFEVRRKGLQMKRAVQVEVILRKRGQLPVGSQLLQAKKRKLILRRREKGKKKQNFYLRQIFN